MALSQIFDEITFVEVYEEDADLRKFGSNSLAMFVLPLYLRLEDPEEFASIALTDSSDDKKIDICYLNEEIGYLLIAQSYISKKWGKDSASSNKATDINGAIAWLLSADIKTVPAHLESKAQEIRMALFEGSINRIELMYIHNCQESKNVVDELKAATASTRDIIRSMDVKDKENNPEITKRELGINSIEELYRSRDSEIMIDDWIDLPVDSSIEYKGDDWSSILTSIPSDWISSLFNTFGDRLFSANYRDYLGYSKTESNINYQIKSTANEEPNNFWVYNNGITALTNEIDMKTSRIRGISIINGAQTTGALAAADESAAKNSSVMIRIVESKSPDLIDKIIRFNNTQNAIKPSDRRSLDQTQNRIRTEFKNYDIEYVHRRSATRTPRNAITAASIAPNLCAFHGDPITSFRKSTIIFNDDEKYQSVFRPDINVEHIFLIRTLASAIDTIKTELKKKVVEEDATSIEINQYEVLKFSASKHFLLYVIGLLAEEILGRRVTDLYDWKCHIGQISNDNKSLHNSWKLVLQALLPNISNIIEKYDGNPSYEVPRNFELSTNVAKELKGIVAGAEPIFGGQFDELRQRSVL